jgi:hypothetical protein
LLGDLIGVYISSAIEERVNKIYFGNTLFGKRG